MSEGISGSRPFGERYRDAKPPNRVTHNFQSDAPTGPISRSRGPREREPHIRAPSTLQPVLSCSILEQMGIPNDGVSTVYFFTRRARRSKKKLIRYLPAYSGGANVRRRFSAKMSGTPGKSRIPRRVGQIEARRPLPPTVGADRRLFDRGGRRCCPSNSRGLRSYPPEALRWWRPHAKELWPNGGGGWEFPGPGSARWPAAAPRGPHGGAGPMTGRRCLKRCVGARGANAPPGGANCDHSDAERMARLETLPARRRRWSKTHSSHPFTKMPPRKVSRAWGISPKRQAETQIPA